MTEKRQEIWEESKPITDRVWAILLDSPDLLGETMKKGSIHVALKPYKPFRWKHIDYKVTEK